MTGKNISTSCIVFLSKTGIVAASDSDYSIRSLTKKSPVAIAVDICSPIPWKSIIDEYGLENNSISFSTLQEAYHSFAEYFRNRRIVASVLKKDITEDILFMGFNENDLYPTLMGAEIEHDERPFLEFSGFFQRKVTHEDCGFYNLMGDWNFVSPILAGASDLFMESVAKIEVKLLSMYRAQLLEKMIDLSMDKKWINNVENFEMEKAVDDKICDSIQEVSATVAVGIDGLSLQELAIYADSLINAEKSLGRLKSKEKGNSCSTREIAVMTIPEGLTWVKHHLLAT